MKDCEDYGFSKVVLERLEALAEEELGGELLTEEEVERLRERGLI